MISLLAKYCWEMFECKQMQGNHVIYFEITDNYRIP